MSESFPRTLSVLRKEKKISQKQAAAALKISQALLSHYENGLREPGLDFAVRAAKYYNVSTDYLLGMSMDKTGKKINADEVPDAVNAKENKLQGNAAILLHKKIIVNSVSVLFDLIAQTESKTLAEETAEYLELSVYKIFRYLYGMSGKYGELFSVPDIIFAEITDMEMKRCEAAVKSIVNGKTTGKYDKEKIKTIDFEMSQEYIKMNFPNYYQSLFAMLHYVGEKLSGKTE